MKKALVIALVLVVAFGLFACTQAEEEIVSACVEEITPELEGSIEALFKNAGLAGNAVIYAEESGIFVDFVFDEIDSASSVNTKKVNKVYETLNANLQSLLEQVCEDTPEVKYLRFEFCMNNGEPFKFVTLTPAVEEAEAL